MCPRVTDTEVFCRKEHLNSHVIQISSSIKHTSIYHSINEKKTISEICKTKNNLGVSVCACLYHIYHKTLNKLMFSFNKKRTHTWLQVRCSAQRDDLTLLLRRVTRTLCSDCDSLQTTDLVVKCLMHNRNTFLSPFIARSNIF